jgi:hypothetical protein
MVNYCNCKPQEIQINENCQLSFSFTVIFLSRPNLHTTVNCTLCGEGLSSFMCDSVAKRLGTGVPSVCPSRSLSVLWDKESLLAGWFLISETIHSLGHTTFICNHQKLLGSLKIWKYVKPWFASVAVSRKKAIYFLQQIIFPKSSATLKGQVPKRVWGDVICSL